MNYRLVVPSRERANWLMTRNTNTIKYVKHLKPILYVRDDDSQFKNYEQMCVKYNVELKVQDSKKALGAAQTYDSLIDWSIKEGVEHLVILDDDLFFNMHNPIIGAKPDFKSCTPYELSKLLDNFSSLTCKEVPAMSLNPIMTRTKPNIINYALPLMWTYSFYLPHFAEHPEHRFWLGPEIEARCDLNLTLKLLTDGYLTAFMSTCFIPDNVNNPGGCSTYRDIDFERKSVAYLKEHYPAFVTTRPKKGWLNDTEVIREAPHISWKKAFNREKFKQNFNEDLHKFLLKHLTDYEKVYSAFVEELRNASTS